MMCGKFDAYESGRLDAKEFAEHVRECAECAELAALDARLDRELIQLREAVPALGLWDRIGTALATEKDRGIKEKERRPEKSRFWLDFWRNRRALAAAWTAALMILVVGSFVLLKKPLAPSGILARRALANVEIKEKEYTDAIAVLETQAGPKIEAMDLQLASLYRDKLATINAQIERCRDALASNPANAHIRQYLLAALHDKQETLIDVYAGR